MREHSDVAVFQMRGTMGAVDDKLKFAVFFDYDNIEIGVRTTLHRNLDVACILEGVNQRGEIVSKVAYGNWSRHPESTRTFTEYGVHLVQRDSTPRGDKNGADINLALDALEMAFTRDHINAFAIISGDSDFMALVNKLKQFNKRVYIVGGKQFTSTILQRNCHEFISYESLMDILPSRARRGGRRGGRPAPSRPAAAALPLEKALSLLDRALTALEVRGAQPQLGLLKSTMQQLNPAFSERDFGVSSFSNLIEKLEAKGQVRLTTRDNHLVVERVESASDGAEAEEEDSTPATPDMNDAMDLLREALASNVSLLEIGIPEREVEALVRAVEPGFREEDYGCQSFGEILNLAQDKGLLSAKADAGETLRFFPGQDLLKPEAAPAPSSDDDEADRAPSARGRRRRGRRGGAGRSRRREEEYAERREHSSDRRDDDDHGDDVERERPADVRAESRETEEAPVPAPAAEADEAPKRPARKTAVRKKAVKKRVAKKVVKKVVKRKTAARTKPADE